MRGEESFEETVRIAITRQSVCEPSKVRLADLLQKEHNATIQGPFSPQFVWLFPCVLKAAGFKSPNYANLN